MVRMLAGSGILMSPWGQFTIIILRKMFSLSESADEVILRGRKETVHSTRRGQLSVVQSVPPRKGGFGTSRSATVLATKDSRVKVAECPICFEEFNEDCSNKTPRNLSCGHAYCTECLKKLIRSCALHIECPTCSGITVIKDQLVSSLPKNYALLQVMRTLVDSPQHLRRHEQTTSSPHHQPPKCPEHDDYLRSYCLKDGQFICSSCELYGTHRGHPTKFLAEAASMERHKLAELNPEVLLQKKKMEEALAIVEKTSAEVQSTGGRMEDEVDEYFQNLVALITEKKQSLKTDIRLRTQLRTRVLLEQAKEMRECVLRADTVHKKTEKLLYEDDYSLLKDAMLMLDLVEGVFINPPSTTPSARNDLLCKFAEDTESEISCSLTGAVRIVSDMLTIESSKINVQAFHNGFRISWDKQNFADNHAITYHLQSAVGDADYTNQCRGSSTKHTWKTDLEDDVIYKFRVQVRTTECVGNWSQPKEARKAAPDMHWHSLWRSVKVELSSDKLTATCRDGGSSHHWATFAADKLFEGDGQYYTEIEIMNIGKAKTREKLAISVVQCNKSSVRNVDWQNRKHYLGEEKGDTPTWSYLPFSGVIKSHTTPPEGVPYSSDLRVEAGDHIGVLVDMYEKNLTFFCNGDLGVAFNDLVGPSFLLAVSIRAKMKVRLCFTPPPYSKRTINVIRLKTHSSLEDSRR